jgi:hypothetical protein
MMRRRGGGGEVRERKKEHRGLEKRSTSAGEGLVLWW